MLPALNFTALEAGICSTLPGSRGFLPVRAALCTTEKVPKPIRDMESPFLSAPSIAPVQALRALSESALLSPASAAIASTSSDLVISYPKSG